MPIRAKHVQEEIKKAEEATKGATVVQRVVIKLLTLVLRILLTMRLNQVKTMEKLGVEKTQPYLPRKDETDKSSEVEDVEKK